MAGLEMGLDISHMDEEAVLQALDFYSGSIFASHANAAALLKGVESNRFLSTHVIHGLLNRDAVIGIVPYNRFLIPGWKKKDARPTLDAVVAQIDFICQLAGDARHVGIGSDFDGGFGVESTPEGLSTIADLHKLAPLLSQKGYSDDDIAAVMGQNWIAFLQRSLPKGDDHD
jgi:membrane dipeptidase